jgi:hypothetical protein
MSARRLDRYVAALALGASLWLVGAPLGLAGDAKAQPGDKDARGDAKGDSAKKYAEALQRFDARDYEDALLLFREVVLATGSPNARLYVGRSLRELARLPEAYDELRKTLEDATKRAESEAKYVPTRDAAAAEVALLERKVARVTIALVDAPAGTVVRVNGAVLPTARLGEPVAVPVGRVQITAEAPGKQAVERSLELAGGASKALALDFASSAPVGAGEGPRGGELRVAGFVVGGLGVVGLGVGAALGGIAAARFDEVKAACGGQRCTDAGFAAPIDEGRSLQTGANVSLVAGGALALAGLGMIVFGGPRAPARDGSARGPSSRKTAGPPALVPFLVPTPRGGALTLGGRF